MSELVTEDELPIDVGERQRARLGLPAAFVSRLIMDRVAYDLLRMAKDSEASIMLTRDSILERFPKSLRLKRWIKHEVRTGEPELRLVAHLLKDSGAVIDVGANAGIYSAIALQKRRWVTAFEPVPEEAARLRRLIGDQGAVHQVALSDSCGKAVLHVPYVSGSDVVVTTRSSLEANVDLDLSHRDIEVEVATLDSFGLADIAFIKIDVEGHELPVLKGSTDTIARSRPNLLVEVEESRVPGCFQAVADFFSSLDYNGFWFDGQEMHSIKDFQPETQQINRPKFGDKKPQSYINNFVWLPQGRNDDRTPGRLTAQGLALGDADVPGVPGKRTRMTRSTVIPPETGTRFGPQFCFGV